VKWTQRPVLCTWLTAVQSAPARSSSFITATWPPRDAQCSAVLPPCTQGDRQASRTPQRVIGA
jgi:hypothetical protein